ncbi:hypothetical protein P9A06_17985 [Serratia marcescens]|uniref:hypothetical protein n=1 Tax=Serratia marcescens TaxID=615 RepID=UPI003204B634
MKRWTSIILSITWFVLPLANPSQAALSITTYNTGEYAGSWGNREWNYVSGGTVWQEQYASAVQVGCTAVLGCSLAIGTVHKNTFYPRYGFINISRGATWEDIYSSWISQHGTSMTFRFSEPVERLKASDTCSTIALYWDTGLDGGYSHWQSIPESQCAPII